MTTQVSATLIDGILKPDETIATAGPNPGSINDRAD